MNGRFNPRIGTIRAFFYKIRALFFDFQKRTGEVSSPSPRPWRLIYWVEIFGWDTGDWYFGLRLSVEILEVKISGQDDEIKILGWGIGLTYWIEMLKIEILETNKILDGPGNGCVEGRDWRLGFWVEKLR